jgi:hypothetical protein
MSELSTDPIEAIIQKALDGAGVHYRRGVAHGEADFILNEGINIECKAYYTERAIRQLADKPNTILVQGMGAAIMFASLINPWR